jgi:osmoprotectant transport system permease protein
VPIINSITSFINFIVTRKDQLTKLIIEHIQLTVFAVILAIVFGIPLGILITRYKKLSTPIIGFANIIQAIPSLALLGFLIPLFGIGSTPAILMVFLYSLLPIIKNAYTGLVNINPDIIEAAKGMGMTNGQILRLVQLPLALPIIMTGIRISAVTAVGLMTIAAFIGAGGLGYMVFSGVQTVNNNMILAGAIPACLLALLMDFIVGRVEKAVTPPGIRKVDGTIKMPRKRTIKKQTRFLIAAALICILALTTFVAFGKKSDTIVIGSKNFNEQLILGHMLGDLIEQNTNIKVERNLNLGGTSIAFNALKSGDIDLYVEYTGTGLVNIMNEPSVNDSDKAYKIVSDYFDKNYNITWLEPLGFNNTYTLAVREDTAKKYNLETFTDLVKVGNQLVLGSTIEFTNREDGYLGLKKTYNMNFKNISAVDGGLRYTSLTNNKTDVIDAFSTDGLLKAFNLKVLKDDKNFFPPYYAAPIINNETLKKHPELKDLINKLAGKLDDDKMRELNYKVDKLEQPPEQVAKDYLKENGLIK